MATTTNIQRIKTVRVPDATFPKPITVMLYDNVLYVPESATTKEIRKHKENFKNPLHGLYVRNGKLMCDGVPFEESKNQLQQKLNTH